MSEKKKKTDGLFDSRIVDSDVSEQPHYEHPHVKGFDGASFEPEEDQSADVGTMEDVEAIMRKYDRESNTRIWQGTPKLIVDILMALFSAYCIYSTLTTRAAIEIRLTAFMGCIMILGFLTYPASKKHVKVNSLPWYDIVLMILGAAAFFYYSFSYNDLSRVLTSPIRMTMTYNIIGIVGVLVLAELCRRCVGLPILCVAGALLIYTFASGQSLNAVIHSLFYSTQGILSTPVNVCAKFIVVFIIFGAFLERTGIANFFIDLANSVAGSASGGPAKVAVVASALEGMVSGSSVANTVGSGSITIPHDEKDRLPRRIRRRSRGRGLHRRPDHAAHHGRRRLPDDRVRQRALRPRSPCAPYCPRCSTSSASSSRSTSRPRSSACKRHPPQRAAEVLPAHPQDLSSCPAGDTHLPRHLQHSNTIQVSASIAIIVAVVASLFDKDNRITPKRFFEALAAGARGTITVAVACGIAGVIAGCITVTGLGSKLISGVIALSGGNVMIGLVLTMICCIILGMGVPTTANYCIMATTCAPILQELGVNLIAAHFFVFYFGIVADITPPVALAAYAGSAIAKSNPMKTGVQATKLAIGAFIVPYVFALNPSMLFINASVGDIVLICATAVLGMFGIAAAMNGYLFKKIQWYMRIAFMVGGLMLLVPGLATDIAGLVLLAALTSYQYLSSRKGTAPAA